MSSTPRPRATRAIRASRRSGARLTPDQVSGPEDNADCLLLEVSGSLRLFGGLERMIDRVRNEFADHESTPSLSVAPCPSAALLFCRNGLEYVALEPARLPSLLGDIPLNAADLEPRLIARLARCGLHRLRDLRRLPRKDLGRRFGADLLVYLDRLSGLQQDPVAWQSVAPCFRQRMALPADTCSSKLILIAAERLLIEARRFLEMHGAATEQIRFDLWHVNRAWGSRTRTTLTVRSGQADRRPSRFLPQLEEQLGRLVIEQEVDGVSILIDQIVPLQRGSEDIFTRRDQQTEEWSQLVELLTARLGAGRVYTLATDADHRPERAWGCRDSADGHDDDPACRDTLQAMTPRPLWLLDAPRSLARNQAVSHGEIERIEAGWWERRDIRRDYQTVESADTSRLPTDSTGDSSWGWGWAYRNRRADDCEQGWHLHGLFG